MKATGIVRNVDELGRVVLPVELRRTMGIKVKDPLEIYVDGDRIVLKKHEPACVFCTNAERVVPYKEKMVCRVCLEQLSAITEGI